MKRGVHAIAIIIILFIIVLSPADLTDSLTTTVRVGYCRYMPPYQYEKENGEAAGFHVELLDELALREDLNVEYEGFDSTSEALEALEEGDVDIVLGVTRNQFHNNNISYSRIISSANICLIAPKNAAKLYRDGSRTLPLSVEYQIISYNDISKITFKNVIIKSNQWETLDAQRSGHSDLVLGLKDTLLWYLDKDRSSEEYEILINYVNSADFTIGVREGDHRLLEDIDNGISQIRTEGAYSRIYEKWFRVDDGSRYRIVLKYTAIGIAILAVVIFIYLQASRQTKLRLAEMVEERTAELHFANEELEKKNNELQVESELRRAIIESSPAGAIVFNRNYRITYRSTNARIMLSEEEQRIRDIRKIPLFSEIIKEVGEDLFDQSWTNKAGTIEMHISIEDMEKKYRYSVHKINRSGDNPEALLMVEDVTVEDREREALFEKRKNATLNQLIVGIAHEIKNPLTAINTSVEMIQTKGNNEKYWKAFSTYIPAEVERITKLINNLVGYARPTEGKSDRINLSELMKEICELSEVSAGRVGIKSGIPEAAIYVMGDLDRIKQSLMNVIFNGIESCKKKASEDHAPHEVKICLNKKTEYAQIVIHDDGVGMTPDEMKRCTEPFYTTKPTGTGIGLSVTKQYIDEIGGSMKLKSIKGKYTTVYINIPFINEETGR